MNQPAQHTPGPWYEMTKGDDRYQSQIAQESTGKTIAVTYTSNDADARLIAAAPELLKAVKGLLEDVDISRTEEIDACRWCGREYTDENNEREDQGKDPLDFCSSDDCPGHQARAIVAKAEGTL